MTALADLLAARIAASGPITLADFMAECLLHPAHGYYATRDPFGQAGDFTTAPEISQMFGELVGLALAQSWLDQGAPAPVTLAELGPGRGTLMADLLRATRGVAGFGSAVRLRLVEASAPLRAAQAARLSDAAPEWCATAEELPEDAPLFAVANEFFDALPIRQFVRDAEGWRERVVTAGPDGLAFALGPPAPLAALEARMGDTRPGDVVELRPALAGIVAALARRVAAGGGCVLIVDYGGWRSLGDTFQAVRAHEATDPLDAPGQADLTAHVDFEAIAASARVAGAEAWGPELQGDWLHRLGLAQRAEALAAALPEGAARAAHEAAYRRLSAPDAMGAAFKAMALTPPDGPAPPGFAAPAPATPPAPSGAAASMAQAEARGTQSGGSGPSGTGPVGAGPVAAGPVAAGPGGTGPGGTGPGGTGPGGTGPGGTGPDRTGSDRTGPSRAGPGGTRPGGTGPGGTGPGGTGPSGTGPGGTEPSGAA